MPLDQRTRRLMVRKLERDRLPKLPLDHEIDLSPPVGIPARESDETAPAADSEKRSGHGAIRRSGDPLARKVLRQLKAQPTPESEVTSAKPRPPVAPAKAGDPLARKALRKLKPVPAKAPEAEAQPDAPAAAEPEPPSGPAPIKAGDQLAALARRRKRKRREDPG